MSDLDLRIMIAVSKHQGPMNLDELLAALPNERPVEVKAAAMHLVLLGAIGMNDRWQLFELCSA